MDLSHWLWLATAAYAVHMLEEFMLDWRDWARAVLGLQVDWADFYMANAIVVVLGIVAANIASAATTVALGFPGLMLVNAVCFHIAPWIKTGGRFSPGLFSAVALLIPAAIACYVAASRAEALTAEAAILSLLIGAALMATPVVLLKIKDRAYFRQS